MQSHENSLISLKNVASKTVSDAFVLLLQHKHLYQCVTIDAGVLQGPYDVFAREASENGMTAYTQGHSSMTLFDVHSQIQGCVRDS